MPGDERPCQRCIKRNLQEACQDGVRKKAKYLHDTPNEALITGIGANHFQYPNAVGQGDQRSQQTVYPGLSASTSFTPLQSTVSSFPLYSPTTAQSQATSTLPDLAMNPQSFSNPQSPLNSRFINVSAPQPTPMQSLVDVMQQNPSNDAPNSMQNAYGANLFDPNDPTQYDFDPASFNFGNHYGALEFGMLGQMASGTAETPPSDVTSHMSHSNGNSYTSPGTISTFDNNTVNVPNVQPYLFNQDTAMGDWRNAPQSNLRQSGSFPTTIRNQDSSSTTIKQEAPYAFPIGATGSSSLASPISTTSPQPILTNFHESPTSTNLYSGNPTDASRSGAHNRSAQQRQQAQRPSTPDSRARILSGQNRIRDSSLIYDSVTQPYSYTTGFHGLTAFLQRRFSSQKTLRIAKALASIRPSFISCTKTLNRDDLIFMEKCFQRMLCEYEDLISATGTPTIICRRTGEVAAVGKEFQILTGWRKSILLGKEANLNVNTGGTSGVPGTGSSSRGGFNTPRVPEGLKADVLDSSRPQPVFLAELLDDDSVIEFYEDFARLAFSDSRGDVTRRGKLLKYKTKEDPSFATDQAELPEEGRGHQSKRKGKDSAHIKREIAGEAETDDLGDKDGKVECSYCWTVKRDVFDIPMMIVINVSIRPPTSDHLPNKF